jgi:putative ABC transport system permease protein
MVSLKALEANKMRSALTMLGIIIGVGAVIAMIAVGAGAKEMISRQIASVGSNLLMVLAGTTTAGGLRLGAGTIPTLSMDDAMAIEKEVSTVKAVAPFLSGTAQVVYGNQNWSTIVNGTTPGVFEVRDWSLASGLPFTSQDIEGSTKVCLLGQTVVDNLFTNEDPLGKVIRIKGIPFTVIGVLSKKGQSPHGQDQDDTILVPITTAQKRLFGTPFPGMVRIIMVKAVGPAEMGDAEKDMIEILRQRHRIGPGEEDDFSVRNLSDLMAAAEESARTMTMLLGAIASVSLLVGGIGIMNIMLVSVTERIREIGLRKAVGARSKDILNQFLTEAIILSGIGGLLGILVGLSGSKIISILAGWDTLISIKAILLAFGFSGIVGIFFGFYPAYKASRLNPIEALRYE